MATREAVETTAKVWIAALDDIPADLLLAGVGRLIGSARWMPKPAEVREACALEASERRRAALVAAQAARATCANGCSAEGWITVTVKGIDHVQRCTCWQEQQRRITEAAPMPRALPAGQDEREASE
jgi:hypothetical protein